MKSIDMYPSPIFRLTSKKYPFGNDLHILEEYQFCTNSSISLTICTPQNYDISVLAKTTDFFMTMFSYTESIGRNIRNKFN